MRVIVENKVARFSRTWCIWEHEQGVVVRMTLKHLEASAMPNFTLLVLYTMCRKSDILFFFNNLAKY